MEAFKFAFHAAQGMPCPPVQPLRGDSPNEVTCCLTGGSAG